jgi:bacterioferritin
MKGHPQVIDALNDALTAELTAVNQYFLHARIILNWGYERLGKKIYEESIGEMKHADRLIQRVLFLEGLPNLQRLGKVNVGETVPEMFALDLQVEYDAVKRYNDGIALAQQLGDNGTRDVFQHILEDSEEHADWLESQLELIKQLGAPHYLAQQVKKEG